MRGKKIFALIIFCLFCGMVSSAKAYETDEMEEYIQNPFYLEHKEECLSKNWTFFANKPVYRYNRPESGHKLDKRIEKGERVDILSIYQTAGESWGLLLWSRDKEGNITNSTGWVKLSDLEFVYDTNAFYTDHKGEMVSDSDTSGLSFQSVRKKIKKDSKENPFKNVIVWSYPCSGEIVCRVAVEEYPTENSIAGHPLYQDKEGRYWMLGSSYSYTIGTKWGGTAICLSEPTNAGISEQRIEPYTTPEMFEEEEKGFPVLYVAGIVAVLAGICVIFFYIKWKRRQEKRT